MSTPVNVCVTPIQGFIENNPTATLNDSIITFYKCLYFTLIQTFLGTILSFIVKDNTIKINYTGIPDNVKDDVGFLYKMITNTNDNTLKLLINALWTGSLVSNKTCSFVINLLNYIVNNLQTRLYLKNVNNRNRLNIYSGDELHSCSSILSTVINYLKKYQKPHYDFYIQKVFNQVQKIELKGHQFSKEQIISLLYEIIETIDTNVQGFKGFTVTVGFCDDSTDSMEIEKTLQLMISKAKEKRIILQLVQDSDCSYIPPTVQQMPPGSPQVSNYNNLFEPITQQVVYDTKPSGRPIQPQGYSPFGGKRTRRKQRQRKTKRTIRRFRRKRRSLHERRR
jgi:hypothetical protein